MPSHTHTEHARTHTHPCAHKSQMHRAIQTQADARTHEPTAVTHVHLKAAERGAQGEGERGGREGPWSLPCSEAAPPVRTREPHSHPLFDPSPRGPILSRCEMCNSWSWHPLPPGGQKGVIPAPILRKGWGRARGPAGVKASRKEALVRHRTGWWGGSSIMSLPPHPQGQESSLGGWGRQGKEAVPIPGAFLVPPGVDWAPSTRGIPKPPTTQLPKAPPPVPGHYCFAAPVGEGPDRPCQAALSPTAPGHCPQGVVSHEVSHRKAASDRGSGAGTGWLQASGQKSGYNPQLHVAPYTGACVD